MSTITEETTTVVETVGAYPDRSDEPLEDIHRS